jgi:uncharacterized protein (DUF2236 family)
MLPVITLPRPLEQSLAAAAAALIQPAGRRIDFSRPAGEPALLASDSVSWRIFKNPISLFVGGMSAVLLELAEPAVRTGVWEHSTFLRDPVGRLRRTGMAAMMTVYGPRSLSEPMIGGVVRMHDRVLGRTPSGEPFSANDPALLTWVHATASFGFVQAYHRFVACLTPAEFDAVYREGNVAAALYGARGSPQSRAELDALFESMRARLERSDIVLQFLNIMRTAPILPVALKWMQPMLVRAAVDLLPPWIRERLDLGACALRPLESSWLRLAGAVADKIVLADGPPVQACVRLGLPHSYLYGPKPTPPA